MKKTVLALALICLGLAMTACGGKARAASESGTEQESAVRPVINAQSSIFNTIKDDIGDVISVDFDAYLKETEAAFMFLEVSEDTTVTMRYTYSTAHQDGVKLGYYHEGSKDKTSEELTAATEEAYNIFWTEEKLTLKKGMNVLFVSGEDKTVKMHVEIEGLEPDITVYAGAFPKNEGQKSDKNEI